MNLKNNHIKNAIKKLLKNQKLTYKQLAEHLDCSEPTIKRVLGPEELSLSRLMDICEFLDVTLSELETFSKSIKEEARPTYTKEQDEFLAENPEYMAYLMHLYGSTPKDIEKEFNINSKSTNKYLLALEKNDLITVTGSQKVKPKYKMAPSFGKGKLAKLYAESMIDTSSKFFRKKLSELIFGTDELRSKYPGGYSVSTHICSMSTYLEYKEEIEAKYREFERLATLEEKTLPKEDLYYAVTANGACVTEQDDRAINSMSGFFGKIKNI